MGNHADNSFLLTAMLLTILLKHSFPGFSKKVTNVYFIRQGSILLEMYDACLGLICSHSYLPPDVCELGKE